MIIVTASGPADIKVVQLTTASQF